jgi:hypothetical protein
MRDWLIFQKRDRTFECSNGREHILRVVQLFRTMKLSHIGEEFVLGPE